MIDIHRVLTYVFRSDSTLRLRVSWNKDTILTLPTKFKVNRERWNGTRCVRNSTHGERKIPAVIINQELDRIESKVESVFREFEAKNIIPAKEEFKAAYYGQEIVKTTVDFWKATTQFLIEGERENQWAYNTIKSIRQVMNLLNAFDPKLTFEKLNSKKLNEFVVYQQKHKLSDKTSRNKQKGYSNSVIVKNCRVVKWFLRWAAEKGYIDRSVESSFRPKVKVIERPVIFLKWSELLHLYTYDFKTTEKNEARDFFCFCCFTSLRYSDASALTKARVKEDHIEVVTQKTSRLLKIELNKYSRAILDKYKGRAGTLALPKIKLCTLDKYLKEMGREAGFDEMVSISQFYGTNRVETCVPKYELLSSHCGRRTFICNALAMGISPSVVMKWTGHSEYSAMKPYIDIADEIRVSSMRKFDDYM